MTISRYNGYTTFIIMVLSYLIIITLFLLWVTGCGEDNVIVPEVVFPDKLTVSEIQPQVGAKLAWRTDSWRLGKLRDVNKDPIPNFYTLWLLVILENYGDRTAKNIQANVEIKTWYGNMARVTKVERIYDDILSPKESFTGTIECVFETKDNIWWDSDLWLGIDEIGRAGLIPRIEFTWDGT